MKEMYYLTCGITMNSEELLYHCLDADLYYTGMLNDYELEFRGKPNYAVATIVPKEGARLPIAIWKLESPNDMMVEAYEGHPRTSDKKSIILEINGKEIKAIAYFQKDVGELAVPSKYYYEAMYAAYEEYDMDTGILEQAYGRSANYMNSQIDENEGDFLESEVQMPGMKM